jgi:magnesium transporter
MIRSVPACADRAHGHGGELSVALGGSTVWAGADRSDAAGIIRVWASAAVQNAWMEGHLITVDGQSHEITASALRALIGSSVKFWLDLAGLDQDTAQGLLRDTFGFHPLAVEDAEHFGQRPKLDSYDGYALMVVYGATPAGSLVEVHCFYTENYLVTVHHDPCPVLTAVGERLRQRAGPSPDHVMLLYRVVDALVDGYFPVLASLDDQIDELEDQILERPTDEQLGQMFDMKRSLIAMRKVVTPQRDMFASVLSGEDVLPGMTPDAERYFRDLYDHLIRISDLVDSYRDLMSGALDTHLSTVSNRLNVVMKQLTIIATVFLPLSFLTGFFGQNFGWMINHLTSLAAFVGVGIGLQILVVVALILLFRQRGWLSSTGTVPPAAPAQRPHVPRDKRWRVLHIRSNHQPSLGSPLPARAQTSTEQ